MTHWCSDLDASYFCTVVAGIERFRFRDPRHTFAARLAKASGNLVDVANVLGHTTIVRTTRYAHAILDRVAEARDELARPRAGLIPLATKREKAKK